MKKKSFKGFSISNILNGAKPTQPAVNAVVSADNEPSYEKMFLKHTENRTRDGKVVYIRKEFHERIMRIVQVVGDNEYSLFEYLDNVLNEHFSTYQEEITELYRERKPKDIF